MTNTANARRLAYVGTKPGAREEGRDSDAWFTPPVYLDAAREVMGSIDFDPFSSAAANAMVKADLYYTERDNSLVKAWPKVASVWMNPPYSAGLCAKACERFLEQYEEGKFRRGIVLVNNATDTRWFKAMVDRASAVCFTDHRIAFWNADGKKQSGNTRGQAFFLFSRSAKDVTAFRKRFGKFGFVLLKAEA